MPVHHLRMLGRHRVNYNMQDTVLAQLLYHLNTAHINTSMSRVGTTLVHLFHYAPPTTLTTSPPTITATMHHQPHLPHHFPQSPPLCTTYHIHHITSHNHQHCAPPTTITSHNHHNHVPPTTVTTHNHYHYAPPTTFTT